jgi:hypothetical protein
VFDPLAVLLLIASQFTFEHHRALRKEKKVYVQSGAEPDVASKEEQVDIQRQEERSEPITNATSPDARTRQEGRDHTQGMAVAGRQTLDADDLVEKVANSFVEKKDSEVETDQERERREQYEAKEQDAAFVLGKTNWKEANPDKTLKHYKNLYIKGSIDHLPWEEQSQDDNYKEEGYRQNGEQNDRTLFNRLKNR